MASKWVEEGFDSPHEYEQHLRIIELEGKLASCEKELAEAREDIGILDTSVDQQILEYRAECENSGRKDVLLQELQSRLDEALKANSYFQERILTVGKERDEAWSRLDESMKASEELRAKGRAAWEVLERYLLETRSLDLNRMPGSDDMLIALTGIRFLPPDEAAVEWARQQAEKIGVVERQRSIGPCPVCRSNDTILDATAPPSRLMRCRACSSEWSASA